MANTDKIYRLEKIARSRHDYLVQDNTASDNDDLAYFTFIDPDSSGNYVFEVYPTPLTGGNYFYIRYWKSMAELTGYGDTTDVPMPMLLIDYAIAQIEKIRGKEGKTQFYDSKFRQGIKALKKNQKINLGQPDFLVYRGQRGYKTFYGDSLARSDDAREKHW